MSESARIDAAEPDRPSKSAGRPDLHLVAPEQPDRDAEEDAAIGRHSFVGAIVGFVAVSVGITIGGTLGGIGLGSALGFGLFVGAFAGIGFGFMLGATVAVARTTSERRDSVG
jgi:hypothetical protein